MRQLGFPVDVPLDELGRKTTLGKSIELCAELAGCEPKQLQSDLRFDKGQWSRWTTGQEGIVWPRLESLIDRCGNDAPVLWQMQQRGWDLTSLRRRETEIERQLREAREENAALRRLLVGGGH